MKNIKRIAIIGNAGSGKSTLARKLHKIFNLPVYHLDKYFWGPNFTRPNAEEYKIIHDNLCNQDKWIIDGINIKLLEHRVNRADVIIFLDIPRSTCIINIFKRLKKYYGQEAPASAKDCKEKLSWEFLKFLKWVWDFKKQYRKKIIAILNSYYGKKEIYILKSPKEVDCFLSSLDL